MDMMPSPSPKAGINSTCSPRHTHTRATTPSSSSSSPSSTSVPASSPAASPSSPSTAAAAAAAAAAATAGSLFFGRSPGRHLGRARHSHQHGHQHVHGHQHRRQQRHQRKQRHHPSIIGAAATLLASLLIVVVVRRHYRYRNDADADAETAVTSSGSGGASMSAPSASSSPLSPAPPAFHIRPSESSTGRTSTGTGTSTNQSRHIDYRHSIYESLHRLALAELSHNVNATSGYFAAGSGWQQLWTRDVSYAAELGAVAVHPDVVRTSLEGSVEWDEGLGLGVQEEQKQQQRKQVQVWFQDRCAHFGGWPNLSDAIVGTRGAWSYYLHTGNGTFLSWAYGVTVNSLMRAERDVYDDKTGLMTGCSSFMESNSGYPPRYHHNGTLVGQTRALSTNALYVAGYDIAYRMGRELQRPQNEIVQHQQKAQQLKEAIRSQMWLEEDGTPSSGYYSYLLDHSEELLHNYEALGEALILLDEVETDDNRIQSILDKVTPQPLGLPNVWPKFEVFGGGPEDMKHISQYYHNGRLWPFVMAYYGMAVAKYGRGDLVGQNLEQLVNLAATSGTFAEFYELDGTFPSERREQLWSAAGYLSMIHRGLFGISYDVDGLYLSPNKPASIFSAEVDLVLRNFPYREMILDVTVKGVGSHIREIRVDGRRVSDHRHRSTSEKKKKKKKPLFHTTYKGSHEVTVVLHSAPASEERFFKEEAKD